MRRRGGLHLFLTLGLIVGVLAGVAPAAQAAGATRKLSIAFGSDPTTPAGAGGTVTSSPAGINCSSACTVSFPKDTVVTLTAAPNATSTFRYWRLNGTQVSTASSWSTPALSATLTTVTAVFAPYQSLSVTKQSFGGDGADGRITKSGSAWTVGCEAGTTPCSASDPYNSTVTLTATPAAGSRFETWGSPSPCQNAPVQQTDGPSSCQVLMSAARSVTAQFRKLYDLAATKTLVGNGAGTLSVGGVACVVPVGSTTATCTTSHVSGTTVPIVAIPAAGSIVALSGACTAGPSTAPLSCSVSMSPARAVTATFTSLETLTVIVDGSGSLTSVPAGTTGSIANCTSTCSATFPHGTEVKLEASKPESSRFAGWLGCTSETMSCWVTVTGDTTVTATFGALNKLEISRTASGGGGAAGKVTASGIDCGSDCYEWYSPDTVVVLEATADPGSRFGSWTGPCAETDLTTTTCTVTMSQSAAVTADFVKVWSLTLAAAAAGSPTYGGSVSVGPLVVSCDVDDCGPSSSSGSLTYDHTTTVTLTARPDTDTFVTWSGGIGTCDVHATECIVTMDRARTITATFAQIEYDVTVAIVGTGDEFGSVASTSSGITCPTDCSGSFAIHATVVLTAAVTSAGAARFDAWSGPCTEETLTGATCTVKVEDAVDVTATFVARHVLTVVVDPGDGGGRVTSNVGGIDCGSSCIATYDEGDDITLTAIPDTDSRVISWSGGGCSSNGTTCIVMDIAAATTVTVTFAKKIFTLGVTTTGTGSITSDTGGISCGPTGPTCSGTYLIDTPVTLTADFDPTAVRFDGWGGACAGTVTTTCIVTMTGATSVTATFVTIWGLTVATDSNDGIGSGTITGTGGIDCPGACAKSYDADTSVTLQANPTPGTSMVASWSGGGCSGAGATCTVSMTQVQTVTVTFTKLVYPLTLTKPSFGGGTGTVEIKADSYVCDAACTGFTRNYDPGTSVTLSRSPSAGSWFVGWGGACASFGTAEACTVSIGAATSVTATFEAMPVLTVAKAGIGTGTVTWTDPAGDNIDCGLDCQSAVITNTVITLVATPLASNGSTVQSWSIRACGSALTCQVTMSASTTVTVTFTAPAAYISFSKTSVDSGAGTVGSDPAGISCSATSCVRQAVIGTYANFATVTLTASPSADSYIVGWAAGACDFVSSDLRNCVVTLGAVGTTRSVNVTFGRVSLAVTKSSISQGKGKVEGTGLLCGNNCNSKTSYYTRDDVVTLKATPASGSIFVRWSGDGSCSGSLDTCTLTMDRARSVTAVFGQGLLLEVRKTGVGLVQWPGQSTTLYCGEICATSVQSGATVSLYASPGAGWVFVRWEGVACVAQSCNFTMTAATVATAVFEPIP